MVFAFEVGEGVFLCTEVGVEHCQTGIDVVVGLGNDALLVFDGVVVVNVDDFVDDFLGTNGRSIAEGDVDDGVHVVVACHLQGCTVAIGSGVQAVVDDIDGGVAETCVEEPRFVGHDAAEGSGHSVIEGNLQRLIVGHSEGEGILIGNGGGEGDIVFFVIVNEVYGEGRFAVEVFGAVDQAGLGGIDNVEF